MQAKLIGWHIISKMKTIRQLIFRKQNHSFHFQQHTTPATQRKKKLFLIHPQLSFSCCNRLSRLTQHQCPVLKQKLISNSVCKLK